MFFPFGVTTQGVNLLPYFVGVGSVAQGTGNITVPMPSGVMENDILVLAVETSNQAVATPSGWTLVGNRANTTTRITAFWKRAGASEGSVTVSDPGDHALGRVLAVRNALRAGTPIANVTNAIATVTTSNLSFNEAIVTGGLNRLGVVLSVCGADGTASWGSNGYGDLLPPQNTSTASTTQGDGGLLAIKTGVAPPSGSATPTRSLSFVGGSPHHVASLAFTILPRSD